MAHDRQLEVVLVRLAKRDWEIQQSEQSPEPSFVDDLVDYSEIDLECSG